MKTNVRISTLVCVLAFMLSSCGGSVSQPGEADPSSQTLDDGISEDNFESSHENNPLWDGTPEADISLPTGVGNSIASGSSNDVHWEIYEDGLLVVTGTGDWDHGASCYYGPWVNYKDRIVTAEVHLTGTTDAGGMFLECRNLTTVDLSNFDTSNVISMWRMFDTCTSLTFLDLSEK